MKPLYTIYEHYIENQKAKSCGTGEQGISTEIFLSLKDKVFKEHRIGLLMMLSDYITSTERFIRK